ncbi:MAG: bifunctional folylpolyglutamate synthase/dihydrofolate synthase [Betaproteobacteria bacterium]|nr:MAG: bifunctional folylpolyglutamate synthase/dihydrofolate synthase [Betaproteobacteria bacterium]
MDVFPAALEAWLTRIERLHHRPIDLTLDRVRTVADRLDLRFDCPVFVVGGTNGKGSTCAMLDSILRAAGYRVGLYTSPHLLRFNERARIGGVEADDAALIEQFEAVEAARDDTSLTYFEFTTLAALRLFARARLDALVLEVGLGGRLDAVNIVDGDCAIVTSIALDHVDYLGPTREHIGFEKAHIYRSGQPAICGDPEPPASLIDVATKLGADLWLFGRDFNYAGDRQQWAYGGRTQRRSGLPYPALRGANQLLNASGALAALEALAQRLPVSQQAVRQGLLTVEIAGRFQVLPGRPAVVLDVAHNPHAAAVTASNLDAMGFYPQTHAVFGVLRDKDIDGVIAKVFDRIDRWHLAPTQGERGCDAQVLADRVRAAARARKAEAALQTYASIEEAYRGALGAASVDDRILVFGSFFTVAGAIRARESS